MSTSVQEASGGQVVRRQQEKTTVVSMIQALGPEIQRALPRGMDGDRIARLALTCIRKDKALADCTPESFAGALLTAAAMGLEPGINGQAYLVAYGRECTLIVGYQGFVDLFWRSPLAKQISAHAVHENDEFDYEYGLDPKLTHKPAKSDRGKVTHYYAAATLMTGASVFLVLAEDEVKELRKGARKSSIADPMRWMQRKTAVRQLIKMLPKSAELNRAIEADERPGTELQAELVAAQERPQIAATDQGNVDTTTGEVIEGEVLDDDTPATAPDEPPGWDTP